MWIFLLAFLSMSSIVCSKEHDIIGCQHSATKGRDYKGSANTTETGIPCQRWSDTHPHDHQFTHVGDHNFCRNPAGTTFTQVWCFTTDPTVQVQYCQVPFCPPLCSTSPWTTTGNVTPMAATPTLLFGRTTSHLRSQSASPSRWNSGENIETLLSFSFLTR